MNERRVRLIAPVVAIAILIALWQLVTTVFDIRAIVAPRPTDVVAALAARPGFYLTNTGTTVAEATVGFVIGFVAAAITAVLMANSQLVERLSWPLIIVLQSTPVVVISPILLIWFGFGLIPKALVVALFVFVPFTTNILTGLRSASDDILAVAASVDASRYRVYRHIRIPYALPDTFAAARVAVSLSLVGAVIGEIYGGSTAGLGYQFRRALSSLDPDVAWGCIVILSSIGIIATFAMLALERWVLYWHPAYRRPVRPEPVTD